MGYLENLNFNSITKYLHSRRYKWVLDKIIKKNNLINKKNKCIKIVDIGCGHCEVFNELIKTSLNFEYYGIDITSNLIKIAKTNYSHDERFNIIEGFAEEIIDNLENVDYFLALESLEHIQEKNVLDIILKIKSKTFNSFLFTVPNEIGPAIIFKNLGSYLMSYKRYKEYSLMETINAGFFKLHKLPPHSGVENKSVTLRHKGFDYRFLIHIIHQYLQINSIGKNPFNWIPSLISPSIFIECSKRK